MQFVWIGYLKAGTDADPSVLQEVTDFLQQPYIPISSCGPLRDDGGNRAGMLMIFDVADRAAAEELVKNSPFLRAGLYEQHHLFEYQDEIG
jgi:uncharacterized protein YciI